MCGPQISGPELYCVVGVPFYGRKHFSVVCENLRPLSRFDVDLLVQISDYFLQTFFPTLGNDFFGQQCHAVRAVHFVPLVKHCSSCSVSQLISPAYPQIQLFAAPLPRFALPEVHFAHAEHFVWLDFIPANALDFHGFLFHAIH